MKKTPKIFEELARLAEFVPAVFYWTDAHGVLLGTNQFAVRATKEIVYPEDIVGKTPYDLYGSQLAASSIDSNLKKVVQTKKAITVEEGFVDLNTKKMCYYNMTMSPLFEGDEVVGVVGVSVEITAEKEAVRLEAENKLHMAQIQQQLEFKKLVDQIAQDTHSHLAVLLIILQQCIGLDKDGIFSTIKKLAATISIPIYWLDANNAVLGANQADLDATGCTFVDIGKTPYDLMPHDMADHLVQHNNLVMKSGKILSQEERVKDLTTGQTKYFNEAKAPLYDQDGSTIGILITAVDITTEKNAERLKLEAEIQKIKIQEQETFKTIAGSVSHDIRSPIASLNNIVRACTDIPEVDRLALRNIATRINDIANNLLNSYKKFEAEASIVAQKPQPLLVSLALTELVSAKRYKYTKLAVEFELLIAPDSGFVFINIDQDSFKRSIVNLINNAVEALDGQVGRVSVQLECQSETVKISIKDNGKGIPQEVLAKINNGVSVTKGKKDGNGIGLLQVRSMLMANRGKMSMESIVDIGTKITLIFPKFISPSWIAEQVVVHQGDTIIVLDDDVCIHDIWEKRFKIYGDQVTLIHFTLGVEAIQFIDSFPNRQNLFLLSDFELIKQDLNGIEIIEQTAMQKQSLLITSHYDNQEVHQMATKIGVKILPKQLALDAVVEVKSTQRSQDCANRYKKTSLVIIDDDQMLADSMANLLEYRFEGVETYYHPDHFLRNLHRYEKNTIICMDHDFKAQINGFELAKQLNELGYTKLYLFTGSDFNKEEVPDYLTVISKGDLGGLDKLT